MLLFFHAILTYPVFLINEADEECHKPSEYLVKQIGF